MFAEKKFQVMTETETDLHCPYCWGIDIVKQEWASAEGFIASGILLCSIGRGVCNSCGADFELLYGRVVGHES
jgi:hypothetical protein